MTTDTLSFDSMVGPYHAKLKAYAMGFTNDEDNADDLLQDTLLKAFTYYGKFKPETNFRAWLFTIMKNTFINNYRRNARVQRVVSTEDEISSNQLMHSASRNNGELKFINDNISKALKTLPDNLYDPFMRYFEGYKYHEIAEEFNMPIGTVKTRIHYARMHLKKYLKVYEELKCKIK
eukprot:Opistho-1_new@35812